MAVAPFQVRSLYEYSSPHDDDLSFPNGQVITVTEEEGDDWYYGEYVDKNEIKREGLFPRNFVKMYEPETPPRPSRLSRSKKDIEPSMASNGAGAAIQSEVVASPAKASAPITINDSEDEEGVRETVQPPAPASTKPAEAAATAPPVIAATKPASSASSKTTPTPASESVSQSGVGSFRDRINAFNRPAAPPIAPAKPSGIGSSGGSGFVKKAFVAPPPSKNAYVPPPREVPPQKIYRREEEPESASQTADSLTRAGQTPESFPVGSTEDEVDQPKPTTLKDRIALLQRQQMEQAARHAEAAQKRDKPKRPPKKRMESQEPILGSERNIEGDALERVDSGESTNRPSVDMPRKKAEPQPRSVDQADDFSENASTAKVAAPLGQLSSDTNDADVSGAADTEDGSEVPTSRDEVDDQSQNRKRVASHRSPEAPTQEPDVGDEEDDADEEDQEEEDVDPEVKRRMEIRERMAKMSGGMGMAGMFGPSGGMRPIPPKRSTTSTNEKRSSGNEHSNTPESSTSRAPPVPIMPMPGLTKVQSPEEETPRDEVSKDEDFVPKPIIQSRSRTNLPDDEDTREEPVPPLRRSTDRGPPPPIPQGRPVPVPPNQSRGPPPPTSGERPVPPPPPEPTTRQLPPPSQPLSPSEGSESDDELSLHPRNLSLRVPTSDTSRPTSSEGPPPILSAGPPSGPPPTLPSRPTEPQSQTPYGPSSGDFGQTEVSPTSPATPSNVAKRSSRVPTVHGSSPNLPPPPTPQSRAPPPPPTGPPSRAATGENRAVPPVPKDRARQDSEEEVTEYEGDYDTDIASSATHKAALKSHSKEPPRDSSFDDDSRDDALHHSGLPSLGPTSSNPPRAGPPPLPAQPAKNRQSVDVPRALPPPPPLPKDQAHGNYTEDYDPYNYSSNQRMTPSTGRNLEAAESSRTEELDDMYSASPPQRNIPPSPSLTSSQYALPPSLSAPSRPAPRQSLDVQRTSTSGRRSMDAPRTSTDHGFIAGDLDLGSGSMWWTQPNMPPPALQSRRDIIYEVEESITTKRGGRQAVTKNVYVLYMDYSQTSIAAHFESREPSDATLEQHHEPPPPRLRQDQLETAHTRFGVRIAEGANLKKETVVGDGTPNALVLDLMSSLPDALRPVGVRAYGALVYANLANASVQQFDEIRSGDIVTFRNTKFQGHRGPMHSKYGVEIGKPDHVAVVVDWDGTKKKVRAWEQGRESKKVRMESFKLGDMKSGEVKVWRVMARQWIGWE